MPESNAIIILLDRGLHGAHGDLPIGGGQMCRQEAFARLRKLFPARYVFITNRESPLCDVARRNFDQVLVVNYGRVEVLRHNVGWSDPAGSLRMAMGLLRGARRLVAVLDSLRAQYGPERLIIFPNENYSRISFVLLKLLRWRRLIGVTVVDNQYSRGPIDRLLVPLYSAVFSKLFAASNAVAGPFRARAGDKLRVVYSGVNLAGLPSPRARERKPGQPLELAWMGSLIPLKRPRLALEIVRLLLQSGVAVRLNLVGGGLLRQDLKLSLGGLGLKEGDHIVFHGHQDWRKTMEIVADCHVLLHTSASESFGRVVVEGQALGLPAVVGAVGALPEVIDEGRSGWAVEDQRPEAYAERLAQLDRDEGLRRRMGQRGIAWSQRFDTSAAAQHYAACFARLLDRPLEDKI